MNAPAYDTIPDYACHCLNVQLTLHPNPPNLGSSHMTSQDSSSQFTSVFVGDEGVRIEYPRATHKRRLEAPPPSPTGVQAHWVQITCLICRHKVYRVKVVNPVSSDNAPQSESEWIDQTIFRSVSGWVQIFVADCLRSAEVQTARKSRDFSPALSLVLHRDDVSNAPQIDSGAPRRTSISPVSSILSTLPQFLPPSHIISSNPTLNQFAMQASRASQKKRAQFEETISRYVQQQLTVLEKEETELRGDLSVLWHNYKRGYREVTSSRLQLEKAKANSQEIPSPTRFSNIPLGVYDFSRSPLTTRTKRSSPPVMQSTLSQSLAASGMYFRPMQVPPSPPESSASSTLAPPQPKLDLDQTSSLRWIEASFRESRRTGPAGIQSPVNLEPKKHRTAQSVPTTSAFRTRSPEQEDRKGKRKVTFSSTPQVLTIRRQTKRSDPTPTLRNELSLFDLEEPVAEEPPPTLSAKNILEAITSPSSSAEQAVGGQAMSSSYSLPHSFTRLQPPPELKDTPSLIERLANHRTIKMPNGNGPTLIIQEFDEEGGSDEAENERELPEIWDGDYNEGEMAMPISGSVPMAISPIGNHRPRMSGTLSQLSDGLNVEHLLEPHLRSPSPRTFTEHVDALVESNGEVGPGSDRSLEDNGTVDIGSYSARQLAERIVRQMDAAAMREPSWKPTSNRAPAL